MASYFSGGVRLGFSPPPPPPLPCIKPWMRVVNILAGTKFWEIFTKTTKPHLGYRGIQTWKGEEREEGRREEGSVYAQT